MILVYFDHTIDPNILLLDTTFIKWSKNDDDYNDDEDDDNDDDNDERVVRHMWIRDVKFKNKHLTKTVHVKTSIYTCKLDTHTISMANPLVDFETEHTLTNRQIPCLNCPR